MLKMFRLILIYNMPDFNSNKYFKKFNDKYQLVIKMTPVSDLQVQLHRSVVKHVLPKQ